jgi:hypothetical protein
VGRAKAGSHNRCSATKIIRNVADKKDGEKNMRPILEKVIMLSLIQSALERKNQLRQAAMRTPQISRDICRSAVN